MGTNDEDEIVTENVDDGCEFRPVIKYPENNVFCNPHGTFHRFVVYIFMCFLNFGNYFIYDNPSALQNRIIRINGVNDEQFGLLYSVYSWPSVVFSFFGGYLTDRLFGVRWASIIFSSFVALGQFILSAGAYVNLFWLMVVGRFIYAIGAENLSVTQSAFTVKWFKGKELNTVFGIQLSFAKSASSLNQFAMLPIYDAIRSSFGHNDNSKVLGITLFMTSLACLISVGCGIALWWFDKRRDSYLEEQRRTEVSRGNSSIALLPQPEKEKFSMKKILEFPMSFWLLCFVCVLYYCSIDPLISFGQLFYVNKFNLTPYQGSVCNGLIPFIAILGLVLCGLLIDCFGRNVQFIVVSIFMALLGHCMLAFTFYSPFIATAILGCAYSLMASALWPAVAYVVPEHAIGTAYGVMLSLMNLGFAVWYMVIGLIVDRNGYLVLELSFILGLCLALSLSCLLFFADYPKGYMIMDGRKRRQLLSLSLQLSNINSEGKINVS